MDYQFQQRILESVVAGVSALDIPRLEIKKREQATNFISTYGYDTSDEMEVEKVWAIHRRAVTFIREHLLEEDESIPEVLTDPNQLKDISYLLIYASTKDHEKNRMQMWACAILRVMHVMVHLGNDLSQVFLEEIQAQILRPFHQHLAQDPAMGLLQLRSKEEQIRLHRFDIKPLKRSESSVIKLLAKPKMVALNLLDTIGVRFVTRGKFDAFRVVRFLVQQNIISFPHVIVDQSANTLYPLDLFLSLAEEFKVRGEDLTDDQIEAELEERLKAVEEQEKEQINYQEKENLYSAADYRFIKFITRRRVSAELKDGEKSKTLNFFYPYEVQIVDYQTYIDTISGPAAHDQYKERQRRAARRRLFGFAMGEETGTH